MSDQIVKKPTAKYDEDNPFNRKGTLIVLPSEMGYSQNKVLALGLFFVLCNILLNFDNGALPACLTNLMDELKFNKVVMGSLGSYVYFGFVIGSIANGSLFVKYLHFKNKS